MKVMLSLALLCAAFGRAVAQIPDGQALGDLHWHAAAEKSPPGLTLRGEGPMDFETHSFLAFSVQYVGTSPLQKRLFYIPKLDVSEISTHHYAITGEISYENVAPGGYLEMWSYFASPAPGYPEGAYFSRTMADGGPMGKLEGTSDWRAFWLPFDSTGTTSKLDHLEMNLHLTGPGTVHMRNLKLMQYPDLPQTLQTPPLPVSAMERSGVPGERVVENLTWDGPFAQKIAEGTLIPLDGSLVQRISLARSHYETTLFQVDAPKITENSYGVRGALWLSNVPAGSFLEELDYFEGVDEAYHSRLYFDKFYPDPAHWVLFDLRSRRLDNRKIWRIEIRLVLNQAPGASATIDLSALKLMQYPPGGSAQLPASTELPSAAVHGGFDLRSFLLGVAATLLLMAVSTGAALVWRFEQRRRHERELRRIASLDS